MLLSCRQIDEEQQKELARLTQACQQEDEGLPAIYHHLIKQKRDTESNVLYYDEKKELIGFFSAYFFYLDACEVSLLVHPKHRAKGIARVLLQEALPLLHYRAMKNIIFSTRGSAYQEWLTALGLSYKHSEYHMQRHSFIQMPVQHCRIALRKATFADVDMLCAIDITCFHGQKSMPDRFFNLLVDKEYSIFLVYLGEQVIGKAHIRWQPQGVLLSDIAILPTFQRKGYGGQLLSLLINHSVAQGKMNVALDVEAANTKALNLYTKHGFKTTKIFDFWTCTLEKLVSLLSKERESP